MSTIKGELRTLLTCGFRNHPHNKNQWPYCMTSTMEEELLVFFRSDLDLGKTQEQKQASQGLSQFQMQLPKHPASFYGGSASEVQSP